MGIFCHLSAGDIDVCLPIQEDKSGAFLYSAKKPRKMPSQALSQPIPQFRLSELRQVIHTLL